MDLRKLKTILEIFEKAGSVQEIEISEGEEKLRLVRRDPAASSPVPKASPGAASQLSIVSQGEAQLAEDKSPAASAEREMESGQAIKAPMVGTFYASPAPEEEPYVTVGSKVVEGDVLCIIEAMKLMNEIKAPVSGTVQAIAAHNAEPVGYGDLLMVIKEP